MAEADAAKQAAAAKAAEDAAAKPAPKPKPKGRSPRGKKRQVDVLEDDTPTQPDSQSSSASATPPPKKAAKTAAAGPEAATPPENPNTPTALSAFTGMMAGRGQPSLSSLGRGAGLPKRK